MLMGVNLTGGEYSADVANAIEGVHYKYPTHEQIDYYAANGMTILRLSVLWERMQPTQNGPLDAHHLAEVTDLIDYATSLGIKVELDVHNYGTAFGNPIGSTGTPTSSFADLWGKLAGAFQDNPDVMFGLMNEPCAQTATQWLPSINAAIAAIRDAGAVDQTVLVSGAYWDGASTWISSDNDTVIGKPGAIVDPANNYAIEVHQYLDDTSGQHDWVVSETIGVERLTPITEWAQANGIKLFLGEFGMANNSTALTANANMLSYMEAHPDVWMGAAYIGGGWQTTKTYMFSAEPDLGLIDTPQMDVLKAFLDPSIRTVASSDGGTLVYVSAPDGKGPQLVSQLNSKGELVARYQLDASGDPAYAIFFNADGTILKQSYSESGSDKFEFYNASHVLLAASTPVDGGKSSLYYYAESGAIIAQDVFEASGALSQRTYFNQDGYNCCYIYSNGVLSANYVFNLSWHQISLSLYDAFGKLVSGPAPSATPELPHLSLDGIAILKDPPDYLPPDTPPVTSDPTPDVPPTPKPEPESEPEPPAPPLVLSGFDAGGEARIVPLKGTVTLNFNQAVVAGSGQIIIHTADGSVAAVIAASAAVVSGQTVTMKLPAGLLGGTSYYLELGADAFTAGSSGAAAGAAAGALALEFRTEMMQVTGTASANTLNGTAGGDVISGLAGNDTLFGFAGDDILDGGAGADVMTGGMGDDVYVVDNASDKVVELANEGTDEVRASITYTLAANVENLTLTGTAAINGTGTATANVLTGNEAANTLSGLAGNDTLYGLGGDDRLDGGAGNDQMFGGTGDDTYVVDSAGDQVTELAGEGTDTVLSSVSYTLGDNVENLTLNGSAAINGTGNAGNNVLIGNAAANTLEGGAGNDRLDGGLGNDTMIGGTGDDVYVVDATGDTVIEGADAGTDTVLSTVSYTLGANIETLNLQGTSALNGTGNDLDNLLKGNSGANVLNGGGGNDTLSGLGGADTLIGGNGSDWLVGGAGKDKLTGGADTDLFVFDTAPSKNNVDTITDFKVSEDKIVLDRSVFAALDSSLEASEFAIGTRAPSRDVHLFYNSGTGVLSYDADGSGRGAAQQVAVLQKGLSLSASDFMVLDTKAAGAVASAPAASTAAPVAKAAQSVEVAPIAVADADQLQSEAREINVIKGGSGRDTLVGTSGADMMTGFAGNDQLRGNGGDDWLNGQAGKDTLTGGAGADSFVFDAAISRGNIDRITDFAAGTDKIVLDHNIFTALGDSIELSEFAIGTRAPDADTHLIYNSRTGALYYDADGSGRGGMQQFATLQSGLHLTGADFLIG